MNGRSNGEAMPRSKAFHSKVHVITFKNFNQFNGHTYLQSSLKLKVRTVAL